MINCFKGTYVDEDLITSIARAGKGTFEFARNVNFLEDKVLSYSHFNLLFYLHLIQIIKQLKKAMGLRLTTNILWGDLPIDTQFASKPNLDSYKGEKIVFYALFDNRQPEENNKVIFCHKKYYCYYY